MDNLRAKQVLNNISLLDHDWSFWFNKAKTHSCPVCYNIVMHKTKHNGKDVKGSWERSHIIAGGNGGSDNVTGKEIAVI